KSIANLADLSATLIRPEINSRSDTLCAHGKCLINTGKQGLIMTVWVTEEFVVIQFKDEGQFVGILSSHRAQHSQSRSNGVTSALQRQFQNGFWFEIDWVDRKRCTSRMFNALINWKYGQIPRTGEPTMIKQGLQASQHPRRAITFH